MEYLNIGVVICCIFVVVGYFFEKKLLLNPVTVFCALWAVILFFSSQMKYTMYTASDEKNMMIVYGVIAYLVGYYVNKLFLNRVHIRIGRFSRYRDDTQRIAVPRYQLLYFLCIVSLLYTFYDLVRVVVQSGTFNLGTIQKMLQSGDISNANGSVLNAIVVLFISPTKFILPAITAVDFFYGRRDRRLLLLTCCLIFVNMLSTANRTSFLLFFLWLFFIATLYLYHNSDKRQLYLKRIENSKIVSKISKYKWGIVWIAVVAFVVMSLSRTSTSLFKQIYLYFSMPPSMFEIWGEKVDAEGVYGCGVASLLGFIYPIFYILKNLLGIHMPNLVETIYDWNMMTDTTWVWPGKNIYANAYVSLFWFFYLDGRLIGIIIGMFIFGVVLSKSYNSIIARKHSARQVAIYCCLLYSVLFSFVRFQFSLTRIALGLIFVMFFAYKMEWGEREE